MLKHTGQSIAFTLPPDNFVHIVALGRFWNSDIGKSGGIQLIDEAACQAMLTVFNRQASKSGFSGLLVDYDHNSWYKDKSSQAAGWITAIQQRADGLYAQIRWTDDGLRKVEGGTYRFISPVFGLSDPVAGAVGPLYRPETLINIALTNSPNIKTLKPITNREASQVSQQRKGSIMDYKQKLMELLGLDPQATDEAIAAACETSAQEIANACTTKKQVEEAANRATTAEARVKELEGKELERQVESDLETHKHVILNRETVKASLLSDRTGTLKVLSAIKPQAAADATTAQIVLNRAAAAVPSQTFGSESKDEQRRQVVNQTKSENRCTYSAAWNIAKNRRPDLF